MNVSACLVTRGEDAKRLWSKIDIGDTDECWPFTGAINEHGYGLISLGGRSRLAHRAVAEIWTAKALGPGECVLHRCDNPPCCNPSHLFRGTRADNHADMTAKGRASRPPRTDVRGSRQGRAKLHERDIPVIRSLQASGESVGSIARRFGVTHGAISMILSGKRWRHV